MHTRAADDADAAKFKTLADDDTMVTMRDGMRLARDVYLPKDREGPVHTVFIKTPYDFSRLEGTQGNWYKGGPHPALRLLPHS